MNANDVAGRLANFVIGGTEKAGTTSVFTYLSEHPEVCSSKVKETNFFRDEATGDRATDVARYARFFDRCGEGNGILMEASPGYLGGGEVVSIRMQAIIPDTKLLFLLRDPVDRLYSSFNFHVGKLDLPADLSFEDYVERCIEYDTGHSSPGRLGIGEWYLQAIAYGRYSDYLEAYFGLFPETQIKIMFFEDLNHNVLKFMQDLSEFLEIDPSFFLDYDFRRVNATFSGKIKWLHRAAIFVNTRSESFLRHRPQFKRAIVSFYKKLNQDREGYGAMSDDARQRLRAYYRPSVKGLEQYVEAARIPWSR